ncbi:F-box domain-containing protein [Mycena sanguinolenta]|uniref:F-box domain-containing protein n=1 Tax=Mycena sanguinolenta TaxID=230812 RepID=A0A8H6Z8H4_9AGAR|nr:F-box domain-containing protein [Mycena sanguinolenta]
MDDSLCSKCGNLFTSGPTDVFDVTVAPGTRHYTLLNTNEPPDDSDMAFIHSVISKSSVRLAFLDDKIVKLRETVKKLEDERVSLAVFQTENRRVLSPSRRIPSEVLGEIFSWTLPSIGNALSVDTFNIARSPWLLTHVSSRWRAVSISIPSLWSRIIIDYSEDTEIGPTNYPLNLAKTLVQRAQKLTIHFYGCSETESSRQIQMLEFILQHSSHWEELSLGITSTMLPFVAAFHGQVSSLKRLWIQWEHDLLMLDPTISSIDCFQSAFSLLDFGVRQYIPVPVPVHQLTRYHGDGFLEEQLDVLELASGLVEARINITGHRIPLSDEAVELPSLRRLYVTYAAVLHNLKAPALEGLAVRKRQYEHPDISPVGLFLARSACPLQRLSLTGHHHEETTIQLLQRLPSLTEFVFAIEDPDARHHIDLVMSALIISTAPGSTALAPQLQCIVLESKDVDYELHLAMLQSRRRATQCPLRYAALYTQRAGPDPLTFHGHQKLRREGLDLMVVMGAAAHQEAKHWYYADEICYTKQHPAPSVLV